VSDTVYTGPFTLAIDIGGSGCKALTLDAKGEPISERSRIPTPEIATTAAVMSVLTELANLQPEFDRISVGFPGVVTDGVVLTAVNLHPDWVGFDLASALSELTGQPTRVANDADIQGLAVIEGRGVEMVLTLGTGMGSALFADGRLVPNLELGHHPFRKDDTYEDEIGDAALKRDGKKKWNRRLAEAIDILSQIFNYRMLYLGGGNTKKIDIVLPENVRVVPNVAGLLGGIALWRQ